VADRHHRAECRPYVLREISHQFRLETSAKALEALTTWSQEKLRKHLAQFPKKDLLPPSMRG
jgi:hypothetical protein